MEEEREVPEDLREQFLKYRINIRVLGVARVDNKKNKLTFVASHRRLPHVGSPVAFPTDEVLRELAGSNINGAEIGYFTLGEFVYSGNSNKIQKSDWMQIKNPEVPIKFPIENLVSRRSFIFARAGFGKSNLNKLLFSELYKKTPTVKDQFGNEKPVGTMIFDPDGEYFWPDNKGRPGLCDVSHLEDKLVVFTNREAPSAYYESFVVGGVRLNIKKFSPIDVISLALPEEKQDQQNVSKLKGLRQDRWESLVDLISEHGYGADTEDIKRIMHIPDLSDVEINAIKSNMNKIVKTLHDSSNKLFDTLKKALSDGSLCVIDMSQMRGKSALILSSLIVRNIFNHNSEEFTKKKSSAIPTLLVIEEAQSILNSKDSAAESFVEWVKEGRKYDLGSLMITQQPGSISTELLSQGDNWFIMHLLSEADLKTVKSSNAHFSNDILSVLLNEAIPGQGVMWSSVGGTPYPISLRVLSFENLYSMRDKNHNLPMPDNYAVNLKETMNNIPDIEKIKWDVVKNLQENKKFNELIKSETGIMWGHLIGKIKKILPDEYMGDKQKDSNDLVPKVLDIMFPGKWDTKRNTKGILYIVMESSDT